MFLQASQILQADVVVADQPVHVGHVDRLIIDPSTGSIAALRVRTDGLFGGHRLLAPIDILEVRAHLISVRTDESLLTNEELPRVQTILQHDVPVLGQRAQTESGTHLGSVRDVLVDVNGWKITKYYLQGMMRQQILPADLVVTITKRAVVFSDRVIDPPPVVIAAEAKATTS